MALKGQEDLEDYPRYFFPIEAIKIVLSFINDSLIALNQGMVQ